MFLIKLFSLLPLPILYTFGDLLAFLAYRVFKYRKKVVIANLKNSFPEKSPEEIRDIAKGFYKNLSDVLVETVKGLTIAPNELIKRVKVTNVNVLEEPLINKKSIITLASHQGNWEWLLMANSLEIKNGEVIAAFQQVKSSFFDRLMKKIRSRFGARLVEKKFILKEMLRKSNRPKVIALVADQSPVELGNRFWMEFLHQETPFYSGAEKFANKYQMPVFYVQMKRIKRGYYEVNLELIGNPPYKEDEYSITQAYVKKIERDIRNAPSNWLWSHKRWKHKKSNQ